MKVLPFVYGLMLEAHRERCIALLAKLLSATCSATVRLARQNLRRFGRLSFAAEALYFAKSSVSLERMCVRARERERERERASERASFADSLKLLSMLTASPAAEATALSCN